MLDFFFFFFSSRRRHTRFDCDWSSDVCSSDVGGGASREQVTAAFKIILSDPNVKGILVNIFGGIMQCDIIATGIVEAVKATGLKLPLVVRLEGNNVELGKKILRESGLPIIK